MLVRSIRDEIINLELVKEYVLSNNELRVRDGDKIKKYTLTEESVSRLTNYLTSNAK